MKRKISMLVLLVGVFLAGYALGLSQKKPIHRTPKVAGSRTRIIPAARVVGEDGYLLGWDVIDQNSDRVCSDPFVWTSTREIECDVEE